MKIKNKDSVFTLSNFSNAYNSILYRYQGWLILLAVHVIFHNLKPTSPHEASVFAVFSQIVISTTVIYAVYSVVKTFWIEIKFSANLKRDAKNQMGINYGNVCKENRESENNKNNNNESTWC